MNTGNMPSSGGGGKTMRSANPDDFRLVYGEKATVAIDVDKDGKAENRGSGEAPLWIVDAKHWWSIVIAFRALISAVWHNKLYAFVIFFALLGIIPAAWMGSLALLSSSPRQITSAEGGGLSGAIGNNLIVNAKNFVSIPATVAYNGTIADNLKTNSEIASISPREDRAARR